MKPELTWEYLHSIESDPLPRLIAMNEAAWSAEWKKQGFPASWTIPSNVWQERLIANWPRLVEYDRLTAERDPQEPKTHAKGEAA